LRIEAVDDKRWFSVARAITDVGPCNRIDGL
jgi:hypothetical protein